METCNSYDILISLIKALQDEVDHDKQIVDGPDGFEAKLEAIHYILGQIIRNFKNRKGHRCVSKQALDSWKKLEVGDSIFDYWNQKKVFYKNEEPVHLKGYNGAKNTPDWEQDIKFNKNGDSFKFREVFHIEHIVPIKIIINQLLKVDLTKEKNEVYKDIDVILDKIYVCFITKDEDRKLNKVAKTNRPDNYIEVINKIYKEAGIEIALFQEK